MKLPKERSILKNTRMLKATILDIRSDSNSVDLSFGSYVDYPDLTEVEVHYLCQEPRVRLGEVGDGALVEGKYAFSIGDSVIVEWTLPDEYHYSGWLTGDPEDPPTRENCKVIGFSDGFPRICHEGHNIVAICFESYVAFYNCDLGECFVPDGFDESLYLATKWSGGSVGVSAWAYYKLLAGVDVTEFVEMVIGGSSVAMVGEGIEPEVAVIGDIVENANTEGPFSPGHMCTPAETGQVTSAPQADARDVECRKYQCNGGSWTNIRYEFGNPVRIITTDYIAHMELKGKNILPFSWVPQMSTTSIRGPGDDVEEDPRRFSYIHEYSIMGVTKECPVCWFPEYDPPEGPVLLAVNEPGNISIFTGEPDANSDDGWYWCGADNYTEYQIYLGTDMRAFVDKNFNCVHQELAPCLGDGTYSLVPTLPNYPHMSAHALNPTFSEGAEIVLYDSHKLIAKSDCTAGYIIGTKRGQDWNWSTVDEYSYNANNQGDDMFYYRKRYFHENPTPWVFDGTAFWSWSMGRNADTSLLLEGPGHQIQREVYYNVANGDILEYNHDRVQREWTATNFIDERVVCIQHTCCSYWWCGFEESEETLSESGEESGQFYGGFKRTLGGRYHDNVLLVIDVKTSYEAYGWQDYEYPVPTPSSFTTRFHFATRDPEDSIASEWAKNRVLTDSAQWIENYIDKIYSTSSCDSIESFVETLGDGDLILLTRGTI